MEMAAMNTFLENETPEPEFFEKYANTQNALSEKMKKWESLNEEYEQLKSLLS
jgi:hypothetical protein